jgi:hypothetical protein
METLAIVKLEDAVQCIVLIHYQYLMVRKVRTEIRNQISSSSTDKSVVVLRRT